MDLGRDQTRGARVTNGTGRISSALTRCLRGNDLMVNFQHVLLNARDRCLSSVVSNALRDVHLELITSRSISDNVGLAALNDHRGHLRVQAITQDGGHWSGARDRLFLCRDCALTVSGATSGQYLLTLLLRSDRYFLGLELIRNGRRACARVRSIRRLAI